MRLFQCTAAILLWTASTAASSNADFNNQTTNNLSSELHGLSRRSLAGNITLRILPIGASIVWGYESTDGNGFRYPLRNALVWGGNPVNMIGSVHTGTMADNDCECYGSNTIDQMSAHADYSIPFQPNLIVMHMGSNDMSAALDYTQAHVRYGNLIDKFFDQIPNVTIIASTLLPLKAHQDEANYFNAHLPDIIRTRQAAGKKIALADMSSSFFSYADEVDGQHPNDFGYKKMAAVFYQAILEVADLGWLTPPADTGHSDVGSGGNTTLCDKDINGSLGPYQIQYQLGWPDGDYVHASADGGVFYELLNPNPDGIHWADIDGDGIDDYVYVSGNLGQGLGVSFSSGGGVFGLYVRTTSFPANCERAHVQFADINGDGRTDVCCVDNNGDFQCWLNIPNSEDPKAPDWQPTGYLKKDSGFTGAQVRLADIDGDGKADYVGIDADNGTIWGWRNLGPGYIAPTRWLPFGGVAFNLPTGLSLSGWRFADLNGDHKDDLLHVDDHGRVTTWINQRGLSAGSLTPNWIPFGTHGGDEAKPINISFGKFWGTGRADYSVNNLFNTSVGTTIAMAKLIQNLDSGSTSVRGDGTRYCDMTGDGKDDTIWISIMGEINVYGNVHVFGETPPLTVYGAVLNVHRTRREIVLADFDGDKKCDVLLIDKLTGTTTMYRNDFANGIFAFTNIGVVTGSATCTTQYGFDNHDNGVRWHDIDGDGRADFLCFKKNGVVYGYLNKGVGNMINQGMIKHAESRERQNLRMGDINGDGRADLIWVDQVSSAAQVWYNEGPSGDAPGDEAAGTSAFKWRFAGAMAYGSTGRGSCIEFGNINGIGRADYILVYPVTNRAFSEFNVCPGGLEPVAPDLPDPPPITYPIVSPLSGCTSGSSTCCTGGTGNDNYAELCSFTCTYGLCPSPCMCTSNGPGNNPPAANSQISGLAIVGLDSATFDLLCEFACSRGLCPEVSCVESVLLNPPSDLPLISAADLDSLDPTDFDIYVAGDSFWYDYPANNQFSMNLFLLGPATTWTKVDCGPATGPGDYGDTLGCEAMSVAYLFYGLALHEIEEQDTDIITRNVVPRGLHYERLKKWTPNGNNTTHHKLLAQAPPDTWVIVGNGTYNGIPHEMHFIKHENSTGYRVVQNQTLDTPGTLNPRKQMTHFTYFPATEARYYQDSRYGSIHTEDLLGKINNPSGVSEFIGESVEKASAESGRQQYCAQLSDADNTSDPGLLIWDSNALGISASELDTLLQQCREDMLPLSYTIYPRDPFDIAEISALLASFPLANVVPHDSISGWGMLYWKAELTPDELATVRGHKQVSAVYRTCAEGCQDPSDEADRDIGALDLNITAAVQRKKRQTGLIETQTFATTDLAFVSNTIGDGTYLYDSSAGENIFVYVIESRGFDMTHPEFDSPDIYGQTIRSKAGATRLFGRPNYAPVVPQRSHGTAMLAQICGKDLGVAKDIWPILYNWEYQDDKNWVLDALDDVYTDFLRSNMVSPDTARLAVLNLSFSIATAEAEWIAKLAIILNKLIDSGVLPIASAGNDGAAPSKYPSMLGNPAHPYYVPGLLVVGGVETDGGLSTGSNRAPWVTIWAPMLALVPFMNPVTNLPDFEPSRGTSASCAKVSGLAAYFIAFSSLRARFSDVFAVSDYIRENAFARGSSGLPAIYNGL